MSKEGDFSSFIYFSLNGIGSLKSEMDIDCDIGTPGQKLESGSDGGSMYHFEKIYLCTH